MSEIERKKLDKVYKVVDPDGINPPRLGMAIGGFRGLLKIIDSEGNRSFWPASVCEDVTPEETVEYWRLRAEMQGIGKAVAAPFDPPFNPAVDTGGVITPDPRWNDQMENRAALMQAIGEQQTGSSEFLTGLSLFFPKQEMKTGKELIQSLREPKFKLPALNRPVDVWVPAPEEPDTKSNIQPVNTEE